MEHFNKLSPAEAERLAILSEECGELIQAIGKVLRHGYDSKNPDDINHKGNREDVTIECADVSYAIGRLIATDDICVPAYYDHLRDKRVKISRYEHHQEK